MTYKYSLKHSNTKHWQSYKLIKNIFKVWRWGKRPVDVKKCLSQISDIVYNFWKMGVIKIKFNCLKNQKYY